MTVEETTFRSNRGAPMRAWISNPEGPGPHRAVLVIHEIWGLEDNLKAILERFAAEGYVAFCPDLYDRPAPKAICVTASLLAMQRGKGRSLDDLKAAANHLAALPNVDAKQLVVSGFCMGGGFALLMALDPKMRAAAPFYGMTPAYLDQVANSCPVVASYGENDRHFLKPAHQLKRRLQEENIDHDLKIYKETGHSFMTKPRGRPIMDSVGAAGPMKVQYNPDSAEDAWRRILAFFDHQLSSTHP